MPARAPWDQLFKPLEQSPAMSDAACGCAAQAENKCECDCAMQGECYCDATCDCKQDLCKNAEH